MLPILCPLALLLYAAGVVRLRRNGVRWPLGRSIGWVVGLGSVVLVTGTGIGGYGAAWPAGSCYEPCTAGPPGS